MAAPAEKRAAARDIEGAGSYGTTAAGSPPNARGHKWFQKGQPPMLLLQAAQAVGKQCLALVLLLYTLALPDAGISMHCSAPEVPTPVGLACEATKGFVRYFPNLAIVVSLMAAGRIILNHRLWYLMLRYKTILDFDYNPPQHDPLFLLLCGCFLLAVSHFLLRIYWDYLTMMRIWDPPLLWYKHLATPEAIKLCGKIVAIYLTPAVVFLLFLAGSYDTEATLLPLNKYVEEDPKVAKANLGRMPFIWEKAAAVVVARGLSFQGKDGKPCTAEDVCMELSERADALEESVHTEELQHELDAAGTTGTWQLVSAMWPAQVLLDARLSDKGSRHFRYAWYLFTLVSALLMFIVSLNFWIWLYLGVRAVWGGRKIEIAEIGVEAFFLVVTCWLLHGFVKNALVPFRSNRKK